MLKLKCSLFSKRYEDNDSIDAMQSLTQNKFSLHHSEIKMYNLYIQLGKKCPEIKFSYQWQRVSYLTTFFFSSLLLEI